MKPSRKYQNKVDGYGGCLVYLAIIALIIILASSCRTVKYIDRVQIQKDTSALHTIDSLLKVMREDSIGYNSLIEMLSQNQIQFRDTGSAKIVYRPDGSIESVEGQVRTLNSRLARSQAENSVWKSRFDSLAQVKRKDSVAVKTDIKTVQVERKVSVLPWWIWLISVPGLIAGYYLKKKNLI